MQNFVKSVDEKTIREKSNRICEFGFKKLIFKHFSFNFVSVYFIWVCGGVFGLIFNWLFLENMTTIQD